MHKSCRLRSIMNALSVSMRARDAKSLVFCMIGFPAAFIPVLIGKTVEEFSNQVHQLEIGTEKISKVISFCVVLSLLYILQMVISSSRAYFEKRDTISVQKYLKKQVIKAACNVKYEYIQNKDNFLQKTKFVESEAGKRVANVIQAMISWVQNIIALISVLVVMSRVDYKIVVVLVVSCLPSIIYARFQSDEEFYSNNRRTQGYQLVMNDYTELVGPTEMQEVHFWRIKNKLKTYWKKDADAYVSEKNVLVAKHVRQNILCDLLRNSVFIVVLLFVTYNIYRNPGRGVGTFMLTMTLSLELQSLTVSVFSWVSTLSSQMNYIESFYDIKAFELDSLGVEEPSEDGVIEFEHVSFSYPETDEAAVKEVTFKINKGEHVAIVGKNGSGKTTLVNLMCGLYQPTSGEIRVNGSTSINRHYISAVFQDFCKYHASIKENVIVSDLHRHFAPDVFLRCCKMSGVDQFAEKENDAYETIIGGFSEAGTNLSGGQWQKIAIARALYREQANIMLLDEPAAALDPEAEEALYKQFDEMTQGVTTVLISHRMAATKVVDKILVVDNGQVVEEGTHEDLMEDNGIYAELYSAQAGLYT